MRHKRLAVLGGAFVAAGALTWAGWATERSAAQRLRAEESDLREAGLTIPSQASHRFIATSDGGRLHVVEAGEGPVVVLVHGITLSSAVFAPLMRLLAPAMRVVAIDLRGHGSSVVGDEGVGFDRQARDLLEVFEDLAITDALLVGHSMGGMISQVLLAQHPAASRHVAGFVALDTSTGPLSDTAAGRRFANRLTSVTERSLRRSASKGRGSLPGEDLATWLTRASFGSTPEPAQVELARSLTHSTSPSLLADLAAPLLAFDGRRLLAAIRVPTTVVVGSRDLLTPPRQARALRDGVTGSGFVVVKGAGHMVMLEATDELGALLIALAPSPSRS
jgi:pimeloyl-ACP methyl ester carboxylesterase